MDLNNYKSAIYKINTLSGSGTGFFIQNKEYLITNHHVVAGHREVAIEDTKQNRFLGKVVYINPKVDVAFILIEELKGRASSSIVVKHDLAIQERDKLFVLGFPFGMPFTITEGIVSSPDQPMGGSKYIQTDAAVNPGNSGGPMLDELGNLIAMTTCKFTEADNVGFGIPFKSLEVEIENYEKGLQQNELTDHQFTVACPSCHHLILSQEEYCASCGAKLDKAFFEETKLDDLGEFVEGALKELSMNPVLARSGRRYWNFHQGSAFIRIFVYEDNYLYSTSPINDLPNNQPGELYSYILSEPILPYKLGISEDLIYISYRTHLNDIFSDKQDQIKQELFKFALKADEMDDFLFDQYNCSMTDYSKEELRRKK